MTAVGMVWSYNNSMLGAYMDLYNFLIFTMWAKYKNVIILTDVVKNPFTQAQISAVLKVYRVKMEFNRYLEIYKDYIYKPKSMVDIMKKINDIPDIKMFYYNGHAYKNTLATPFGNINADFIYLLKWSNMISVFDCCHPPTYNLPYKWSSSGQLIKDNIIKTIYNINLHNRILIVMSSNPDKYQYSTIYGSNFTRYIFDILKNSDDIINDKIKHFPDYFISSNKMLDHKILLDIILQKTL